MLRKVILKIMLIYSQALVAADHVSVVVLKVTNATSDGVIPGLETIETIY